METISAPIFGGLARLADVLLLLCAGWLTALLLGQSYNGPLLLVNLVSAAVFSISLASEDAYSLPQLRSLDTQIMLVIKPLALAAITLVACIFLLDVQPMPEHMWPFIWAGFAVFLLLMSRFGCSALLDRWVSQGRLSRKIAIVGVSNFSEEFISRLREEKDSYNIVGIYDDRLSRVPPVHAGIKVCGSVEDLLLDSRENAVDVIVVALPLSAVDRIAKILEQLHSAVADLCLTTDLVGLHYTTAQFGRTSNFVGRNPVISIRETPLKDWKAAKKRCFDYCFGLTALIVLSPVLALVAAAIKIDSPGPVLFRQPRLGFNNRMFLCFKFRSMQHHMSDLKADLQTSRNDPRITRVGKWIRKYSIDELPQLLNVLNGTMSIVGPRPHAPNTKAANNLFADVVRQYAVRHRVKPGITGWAQVNGWRGETKTIEEIENRVKCDLYYIDHWSLLFDLKIVVLTVLREIFSKRAF